MTIKDYKNPIDRLLHPETGVLGYMTFFDTKRFDELVGIINQHESIDGEQLKYDLISIQGLSSQDFGKVCSTIFYNLKDDVVVDSNAIFQKSYVDYDGMRYHLMVGQGSACWTEKL